MKLGGAGALLQRVILTGSGPLPPLSTLLSLLEQASVRNVEVGGAGALPQSQKLFFGKVVLLVRLGLVREKAMVPAHT